MTSSERGRGMDERAKVGIIIPDAGVGADVSYRLIVEQSFRARYVEIEIHDDGPGFDVEGVSSGEGEHVGLLGMRERATLIGADLKIDSVSGKGTTVKLRVPVEGPVGESQGG